MDEYLTTGDLNEIIHYERLDADIEQAQYEAEGHLYWRQLRRSDALRAEGNLAEAATACPHGGGFPLNSIAASEGTTGFGIDPFAGEQGWRCVDCGSRLDASPWDGGAVTVPCEVVR